MTMFFQNHVISFESMMSIKNNNLELLIENIVIVSVNDEMVTKQPRLLHHRLQLWPISFNLLNIKSKSHVNNNILVLVCRGKTWKHTLRLQHVTYMTTTGFRILVERQKGRGLNQRSTNYWLLCQFNTSSSILLLLNSI